MLFDWLIVGQVVEPCRRGARAQARRQKGQDAGAHVQGSGDPRETIIRSAISARSRKLYDRPN
jgi:hypothetical protein